MIRLLLPPDFPPDVALFRPRRPHPLDDYRAPLLRYIPADVVAAWVFLDAALGADPRTPALLHWAVFGAVLLLTPLWTWYTAQTPGLPPWHRVLMSTLSFAVWVFALGGPFARLGWYTPTLAAVLLALYTLAAPLVPFLAERRAERRAGPP